MASNAMEVSTTPRFVIQVAGIRKSYGATVAVSDVSFEVREGEIFGLIGPNGAGKTTTLECVEGVRRPDGGTVSILAYGIVIWAMQYDAMGVVSALRETSVVWAAIIGRIFLKEKLTARRMASCLAIAAGAACLAY